MPARRRELRASRGEVRHVAEPARLSERHDSRMRNQRFLARDIDDDVGCRAKPVFYPLEIGRREGCFAAERDSGLGAGIADDQIGVDPDLLTVSNNRNAFNAAVIRVNGYRRRGQPYVAVALYH